MRIIHVNLSKGFRGGERQTVVLIRALDKLNIEQTLVCHKDSPMQNELSTSRCSIHVISNLALSSLFTSLFTSQLLSTHQTIIHAHESKASQWAYLHYLSNNTPYIITRRIQKRPSNRFFTRLVYTSSQFITCISASVSTTMDAYIAATAGSTRPTIKTIPDALARLKTDGSDYLRDRFPDKFIIGHVGALSIAEKGQDLLIHTAKKLAGSFPDIHFVLIGDGKDKQVLQDQAKNINNISFLGFRKDIGSLLSSMDAFIFPSRHEGLGSSLLDALYFKLPIIASDIPGITDIIRDQHNGLLFPPNDVEAMCALVKALYVNNSLRQTLTLHAHPSLQSFMPELVAQHYLQIYQSVLNTQS